MLVADIIGFWDMTVFVLVIAGFLCWKVGKTTFDSNPGLKDRAEQKAVDAASRAIDRFLK